MSPKIKYLILLALCVIAAVYTRQSVLNESNSTSKRLAPAPEASAGMPTPGPNSSISSAGRERSPRRAAPPLTDYPQLPAASTPYNPAEWALLAAETPTAVPEVTVPQPLDPGLVSEALRELEAAEKEPGQDPPSISVVIPEQESQGGQGQSGNMLGGVVRRSAQLQDPTPLPEPTHSAAPTSVPLAPRVSGQARGYQMLYFMHPRARATVQRQVDAMLRANLDDNYLGVMTDGTFGKDFPLLNDVIRQLNTDGRSVTLVLYLTNGATMRKYDSTPITAGFNRIAPEEFRYLIQYDTDTRYRYQQMVREVKVSFELNRSLNPRNRNFFVPMLEDNLDRESYRVMRGLAVAELGDLAEPVRNPCPGCYEGNDDDTIGDGLETHAPWQIGELDQRGGMALDGVGYSFAGEDSAEPPIESLRNLAQTAIDRRIRFFGLWRAARQGISLNSESNPHPDERNYEIPTDEQLTAEIEILRHGLNS